MQTAADGLEVVRENMGVIATPPAMWKPPPGRSAKLSAPSPDWGSSGRAKKARPRLPHFVAMKSAAARTRARSRMSVCGDEIEGAGVGHLALEHRRKVRRRVPMKQGSTHTPRAPPRSLHLRHEVRTYYARLQLPRHEGHIVQLRCIDEIVDIADERMRLSAAPLSMGPWAAR